MCFNLSTSILSTSVFNAAELVLLAKLTTHINMSNIF